MTLEDTELPSLETPRIPTDNAYAGAPYLSPGIFPESPENGVIVSGISLSAVDMELWIEGIVILEHL